MATEWYLTDKSYYSGFEKEEIEKTYDTFSEFLSQSPETYPVTVEGIEKSIIIQSTANYNERRILFKENDLQWGDLIEFQNEKWLVTERPINNRIHDKSKIELCNNVMTFEVEVEGYFEERDRLGNPIWIVKPHMSEVTFPCVIDSISNLATTTGQQVNIPEGDMVLKIQYTTDELIRISSEFKVFGDAYRISGIDKSKTDGNKGILILVVSRTTNNT